MHVAAVSILLAGHSASPSGDNSDWLFFGIVGLVLISAILGILNTSRRHKRLIAGYFQNRGGAVLVCNCLRIGGRRSGYRSFYRIRYRDQDGEEFSAECCVDRQGVTISEVEPVRDAFKIVPGRPAPLLGPRPPSPDTAAPPDFSICALDHVQLAMPHGQEEVARRFYIALLGLRELPKPPNLATRGGVWFEGGALKLHLGVEITFIPALKAHPALLVKNLPALIAWLERHGVHPVSAEPLPGCRRVYVADPFQNRIELMEPLPC